MKRQSISGISLIESSVVIAIIAILAVLAVPSFQDTLRAQRAEGAAEILLAALHNAKAEAVKRNSTMRIAFTPKTLNIPHSTWCYGMVNAQTAESTCDCRVANSCMAGSVVSSREYPGVTMRFNTAAYRSFSPLRGTATNGTVTFDAGNAKQLAVRTFQIGRARMCRPNGSTLIGYKELGDCT